MATSLFPLCFGANTKDVVRLFVVFMYMYRNLVLLLFSYRNLLLPQTISGLVTMATLYRSHRGDRDVSGMLHAASARDTTCLIRNVI